MKRIFLLAICLVIILVTLISCDKDVVLSKPENADELWERISKEMSSLRSYTSDVNVMMSYEVDGYDVKVFAESETVSSCSVLGIPYYYNKTVIKGEFEGITDVINEEVACYDNFKMYLSGKSGEYEYKLYSYISKEDFINYILLEEELDLSIEYADEVKMTEKVDSGWVIEASSFSEEQMEKIFDLLNLEDLAEVGIEVDDMSMYVIADEKYRITELGLSFTVAGQEEPVMYAVIELSDFNDAKKAEFDKKEFEKVDNVLAVGLMNDKLYDVVNASEASCTVNTVTKVYDLVGNEKENLGTNITDTITVTNQDDQLVYEIKIDEGNWQEKVIKYSDGVLSETVGRNTDEKTVGELSAKMTLRSYAHAYDIDNYNIVDVEKINEGVYRVECRATASNIEAFKSEMSSLGDNYRNCTLYLIISFDGGELVKIESHLVIKGYKYVYTKDMTLTFTQQG